MSENKVLVKQTVFFLNKKKYNFLLCISSYIVIKLKYEREAESKINGVILEDIRNENKYIFFSIV